MAQPPFQMPDKQVGPQVVLGCTSSARASCAVCDASYERPIIRSGTAFSVTAAFAIRVPGFANRGAYLLDRFAFAGKFLRKFKEAGDRGMSSGNAADRPRQTCIRQITTKYTWSNHGFYMIDGRADSEIPRMTAICSISAKAFQSTQVCPRISGARRLRIRN